MENWLIAVIIGIVEGMTEFLPVSSTGHMILVGHMLGFEGEAASVFEVFIQLGAILAVVFFYRDRFRYFFTADGWRVEKGFSVWHVAAGIVPVMGIGYLLHKPIKAYLFSPFTVIIGLVAGGIFMLVAEKVYRPHPVSRLDNMTVRDCLYVGLFQTLALWPGFSRSGSMIAGGLCCNLTRKAAAEFSFVVAVPLMAVACVYDLLKNLKNLSADHLDMIGIGFVVAFFVAYASIVWFLGFLNRSTLASFAYYRFAVAVVSTWYFFFR